MNRPYTASATAVTIRTGSRWRMARSSRMSRPAVSSMSLLVLGEPDVDAGGVQPVQALDDLAHDRGRHLRAVASLLDHGHEDVSRVVCRGQRGEPGVGLLARHLGRPRLA